MWSLCAYAESVYILRLLKAPLCIVRVLTTVHCNFALQYYVRVRHVGLHMATAADICTFRHANISHTSITLSVHATIDPLGIPLASKAPPKYAFILHAACMHTFCQIRWLVQISFSVDGTCCETLIILVMMLRFCLGLACDALSPRVSLAAHCSLCRTQEALCSA